MWGFGGRYYWGRRESGNREGIVVVFAWMSKSDDERGENIRTSVGEQGRNNRRSDCERSRNKRRSDGEQGRNKRRSDGGDVKPSGGHTVSREPSGVVQNDSA
ncbi:hypothetical protein ACFE04_020822 [Oxalis oulophora]